MKTIAIDISNNDKWKLRYLLEDSGVFIDRIFQDGERFGFFRCDEAGCANFFYFFRGVRVKGGIKNLVTGEVITTR